MSTIYYIGPESKVWHARRDCDSLKSPWRYYPLREARGARAAIIKRDRRPCRRCA